VIFGDEKKKQNTPEPAVSPEALSSDKVPANAIATLRGAAIEVPGGGTRGSGIVEVVVTGNEGDAITDELDSGLWGRGGLVGRKDTVDQGSNGGVKVVAAGGEGVLEF